MCGKNGEKILCRSLNFGGLLDCKNGSGLPSSLLVMECSDSFHLSVERTSLFYGFVLLRTNEVLINKNE